MAGKTTKLMIIAIHEDDLDKIGIKIIQRSEFIAIAEDNGYITIKDRYGRKERGDYIDLTMRIAQLVGADIYDPNCKGRQRSNLSI